MLIDTHCHLVDVRFQEDLGEVIERARANSVEKIIVPGTDIETSKEAIELAKQYPGQIFAAVGIHPEEMTRITNYELRIMELREIIEKNRERVVAIGEIGTDRKKTNYELRIKNYGEMQKQKELFRVQCEIALELELPVIIHTRNSMAETLEVLDLLPSMPRGHFHCWSDSNESLEEVISHGFYVGFCGNVTYKSNDKLREQAARVPLGRLLIETDSPYLPPIGKRGERNTPSNVKISAQVIADKREISLEELASATSDNARKLYIL